MTAHNAMKVPEAEIKSSVITNCEEIAELAPMSEYVRLGLAKKDKAIEKILPKKITGLFGLSYNLPAYCTKAEDFVGACYVLNVMANIDDGKSRNEILATSVLSLFNRAKQIKDMAIIKQMTRSTAYQQMRQNHFEAIADLKKVTN